ncbi:MULTISPECIES: hypothetical protein [Parafrankia]|uniref:hypothetical protein n=1 Tax=Parafrankia TaxID=2994362 RepID=UPI0010427B1E|nr:MULTISPECIES: hypothetical protein [Parafrankia]MBE3205137.1 hypothetical protein [Parafrankia sp. CH37]
MDRRRFDDGYSRDGDPGGFGEPSRSGYPEWPDHADHSGYPEWPDHADHAGYAGNSDRSGPVARSAAAARSDQFRGPQVSASNTRGTRPGYHEGAGWAETRDRGRFTDPAARSGGRYPGGADYADDPTPAPGREPGPAAVRGTGQAGRPAPATGDDGFSNWAASRPAYPGTGGFPGSDRARPPASPPPREPAENWLGWVAFLLGIAVLAGGAGYVLNRITTGGPTGGAVPSAAATAGTPTASPADPSQTDPAAGSSGQATGPTAEQVAIMLANSGLPLRTTVVYTAQNDPDALLGRPGGYISRIAFTDTRVSASEIAGAPADAIERGGAIEVFHAPEVAQARGAALSAPSAGGDPAAEYTFVQGRIVLRLSLILTETMAAGYQAALGRIGGGSP